jgi:uncharacterized membrane protein
MNYIKFLFGRKWWGFSLIFLTINIAAGWQIWEDPASTYVMVTACAILDTLLIIFSYNEYKLKDDNRS